MLQDSKKNLFLLLLVFLPCASEITSDSAEKTIYLEYSAFQTLTRLVPEISTPRIPGALTEAGHELWSNGELRLPAQGHFILADLNGDQRQEAALILTDGTKNFLLIAAQENGSWKRKSLLRLRKEETLNWDGKTLVVSPPESFLEWDGREFRLESGPLALYAHSYSTDEFAGVSVKLTYIGEQHGPYPGLLISSYYRFADLDAFAKFHRRDVSYANDEMRAIWHLTMSTQNLRQIVLAIKGLKTIEDAAARSGEQAGLTHSVSILDSFTGMRPNYFEALVGAKELNSIIETAASHLKSSDPSALELLTQYINMFVSQDKEHRR